MSSIRQTTRIQFRSIVTRVGFPHILATTLVLVAATILLGVAAKATGSGLACEANWPQCDAGPYNLFPANLPSFYEWIHRFVAMFAGFAIIASALTAWVSPRVDRRVTALVVTGLILTPIQVILGRETVLQYELEILSLHFWTAVLIFSIFVVATVLVWETRLSSRHVVASLGLGAVSLPFHVILSPVIVGDITSYSPGVQTAQYAVTLAVLVAVIVSVMVGRRRFDDTRIRAILWSTPLLALVVLFVGRRSVMTLNPLLDTLYVFVVVTLLLVFLLGIYLVRNETADGGDL